MTSTALSAHEQAMRVIEGALGTGLLDDYRVRDAIADARACAQELEQEAERLADLLDEANGR